MAVNKDFRGGNYKPNTLVTAQERLEHMRNRARPAPQQHLRPNGADHAQVQSQIEALRERRINHIDTRLMVADFGMNRDRMKAVNQDRAKASFNHTSHAKDQGRER